MKKGCRYFLFLMLIWLVFFNPLNCFPCITGINSPSGLVYYTYRILDRLPHDPQAFTQGLIYHDGYFYESTGLYGKSSLRQVNPGDGRVLRQVELAKTYFGEGIALCNDRIYQLTWRERRAFVYDCATFNLLQTFTYDNEGWGLTYDGKYLIMSDGSAILTFLDPETFTPVRKLSVQCNGKPIVHLNELEYINGKIFANVWLTDFIAIINPATGEVTGWLDLSGLLDPKTHPGRTVDVLNGIAYDEQGDRLFVTGKLWPYIFVIKIEEENFPKVPVNILFKQHQPKENSKGSTSQISAHCFKPSFNYASEKLINE